MVEITDDASGTYNKNSQIKFETLRLKPSLCGYSDVDKLVSETITIDRVGADDNAKRLEQRNRGVQKFTNCAIH